MKKLNSLNFLWLTAVLVFMTSVARAQSFELYFANNVTDVPNLNGETVQEDNNGLVWTKISRGTVNVYGNYVEMNQVREMFASTRMKTLADQQQFWRMRDHSLVCFRIDRGSGVKGDFGVEADDGSGNILSLTVSKFFFSNIPLQEDPIEFKVWKIGEVGDTVRFKYQSDDWDNKHLYVFQLDSKRQLSGEEYTLEYDLSYADENSELKEERHFLDLKDKNFQSFYVPEDRTLTDIFLMAGNSSMPKEGRKRLRLNRKRLFPGASPYNKFYNLTLSTVFQHDKHENRELVNFNWIGSGLYERFDTLYVKLKKPNGDDIRSARMNGVQIDADGNEVMGGPAMKYCGWDEGRKAHKMLTYGYPAYVEILPPAKSNTFYPLVLKSLGATDPLTNIVDEERCTAEVTTVMGNVNYADFAISNQFFRTLNDEKKIIVYRGEDHALVTLQEYDLTGRAVTDEIKFSSDGCQDGPKLFKGSPIEKYGDMVLTFSTPKAGQKALRRAIANAPEMKIYKVSNGELLHTYQPKDDAVGISIPTFERDYFNVAYDLTEMTVDTQCRLKLVSGGKVYDKLPYMSRFIYDSEKADSTTKNQTDSLVYKTTKNDPKAWDKDTGGNYDVAVPINLRFDCTKNFRIETSFYFSILRNVLDAKVAMVYKRATSHEDADGHHDDSTTGKMRRDFDLFNSWDKAGHNSEADDYTSRQLDKVKIGGGKLSGGGVNTPAQNKLKEWVFSEFDDIFSLAYPGFSGQGSLQFAFSVTDAFSSNPTFSISEFNGKAKLSYGAFIRNPLVMLTGKYPQLGGVLRWFDKYVNFITINALAEGSVEISAGYKNWRSKQLAFSKNNNTHTFLLQAILKARGGICAELHTPPNPFGHIGAGARVGAKFAFGWAWCSCPEHPADHGGMITAILGAEAFAFVRTFAFNAQARAEIHVGNMFLIPDSKNNDANPFHPDFPYWAYKEGYHARQQTFWEEPNLTKTAWVQNHAQEGATSGPHTEGDDKSIIYGDVIVDNVASTANPHFLDEHTICYDVPATQDDPNSGYIATMDTRTKEVQRLSSSGLNAQNHTARKTYTREVAAYEEMNRSITAEEMQTDAPAAKQEELARQQNIMSCIRDHDDNAPDASWRNYPVSLATGDMVKAKPVVTAAGDGLYACIWQQGTLQPLSRPQFAPQTDSGSEEGLDELALADSAYNKVMHGELVLSFFDDLGDRKWSEPIKLLDLNEDNVLRQYDLVMRNDTALVGVCMGHNCFGDEKPVNEFTYVSVPLKTRKPSYVKEKLRPIRFFMNMVGEHALLALLYEKNDTLTDIYVKTLQMSGHPDGTGGNDLGAHFCSPHLVKVICDREYASLHDCAILWAEMGNTIHGDQGTAQRNGEARMILNASRLSLQPSICVTPPLTMGAETTGTFMKDFDGFLDDQHIKVVYSLVNLEDQKAVIRQCERYFENSFLFDVSYDKHSLLGSSSLPVLVRVYNTGTSPIRHVTATINGQEFPIEGSSVNPMSTADFTVLYPIDSNFDGYLEASVQVDYQNMFRVQEHVARRGRSLVQQQSDAVKGRVALEDIEMRIISHDIEDGVNTYAIQLIDRSPHGISPDYVIYVGAYTNQEPSNLLADDAEVVVRASDFEEFGGVRKAYVQLRIPGITETTHAYVNCHIYDETRNKEEEGHDIDNYVPNRRFSDNVHYITLQPSNDPTDINPVHFEQLKKALDVKISQEVGGVRISGLPVSDDNKQYRIRVFGSDGILVFTTVSTESTLFVTLTQHDVYLLTTGKDVLKFNY